MSVILVLDPIATLFVPNTLLSDPRATDSPPLTLVLVPIEIDFA